ncbi:MAG: isochorismatase family protein [Planctomycetota bacterium]
MHPRKRLEAASVQLLIVDLQERLMPVIPHRRTVEANSMRLITASALLEIPQMATVQYPKGLGPMIGPVASILSSEPISKMTFSAIGPDPVKQWLDYNRTIVLIGIETHVCIAQTALDLLEMGLSVIIPTDAVAARKQADHDTALIRLTQAGAIPTTTEALLFEWIATAGHRHFKAISTMVKEFDLEC